MNEYSRLNKKDIKAVKMHQKETVVTREHSESLRKLLEDNQRNSQGEYGAEYVDIKAKKWWQRFDERNYRPIERKQYVQFRDLMTSNRLIQCFSTEIRPIQSYAQEKLVNNYNLMEQSRFLHVLFKSITPYYSCLTSFEIQQAIPNYSDSRKEKGDLIGIKISPISEQGGTDGALLNKIREIKLSLAGWNDDQEVCRTAEIIKINAKKWGNLQEIDRQIEAWEKQLGKANGENNVNWNQLIQSIRSTTEQRINFQPEVATIKEYLMGVTMLKYFEHGLEDKTAKMLQALIDSEQQIKPTKCKDQNAQKFFETDCKICFCSFNHDSNQVLYCDKCNTSYHLACYGLSQIPKEEKYFCDCCQLQREQSTATVSIRKLICQICCKTSFPLKRIQGHFYHVTCLAILNFAEIKHQGLVLKKQITHERMLEQIVQSQIMQADCLFCSSASGGGAELGIRLSCAFPDCRSCMHPICAYINGCRFIVKKDLVRHKLNVQCFCNNHDQSRDFVEQTYFRRYMCNLNKTTSIELPQFRHRYNEEENNRASERAKKSNLTIIDRIMAKTKVVKRYIENQEIKANQGSNKVETESRKYLQQLKRKLN